MIYAIIAAVIFAVGATSGWTVHNWKTEAAHASELQQEQSARAVAEAQRDAEATAADQIALRFEKRLSDLRITNKTINNEVRREIETKVYTDCVVPDSGVLLLRRAVDQANTAAGNVPSPVPAAPVAPKPADDGRVAKP